MTGPAMTTIDDALPTNEAGRSRYAVLFSRLETCVAERAGMANGNSWQATMHAAGPAQGSRRLRGGRETTAPGCTPSAAGSGRREGRARAGLGLVG